MRDRAEDCPCKQVIIPSLSGDKGLDVSLTHADFDRLCSDLFDQCSALASGLLQCAPTLIQASGSSSSSKVTPVPLQNLALHTS